FRRHDMDFEIHHELLSRMPESQTSRFVITSRRFTPPMRDFPGWRRNVRRTSQRTFARSRPFRLRRGGSKQRQVVEPGSDHATEQQESSAEVFLAARSRSG